MPAHRHLVPPRATKGHLKLTESELQHWGEQLGRSITPPLIVTLTGDLGVGKTTLARAICIGYGVQEEITSPTYALVHRYRTPGGLAVYHVDCYRLRSPAEAQDLGFDDMMRDAGIVLIEWPERAGPWAPPLQRHFRLSYGEQPDIRDLEEIR